MACPDNPNLIADRQRMASPLARTRWATTPAHKTHARSPRSGFTRGTPAPSTPYNNQSAPYFRYLRPDPADALGAQTALVSDHVRDRVGRGFAAAAGGPGRGLPLRKPQTIRFPGRKRDVYLVQPGPGHAGQLYRPAPVLPDLSRL